MSFNECVNEKQSINKCNDRLYDELKRVLSELYCYCEHESDINECMEVLNVLNKSTFQFHQLNQQILLLAKTNSKNTRAIAWNVSALSSTRKEMSQVDINQSESSQNVDSLCCTQECSSNSNHRNNKLSYKNSDTTNQNHNNQNNISKTSNETINATVNAVKSKKLESESLECWGDLAHDTDFKCSENSTTPSVVYSNMNSSSTSDMPAKSELKLPDDQETATKSSNNHGQVFVSNSHPCHTRKRQLWRRKSNLNGSNRIKRKSRQININQSGLSHHSSTVQPTVKNDQPISISTPTSTSINNNIANMSMINGVIHKPWNKNHTTNQMGSHALQTPNAQSQQQPQFQIKSMNSLPCGFFQQSFDFSASPLLPTQFHPLPPQTMLSQPLNTFFPNNLNTFNFNQLGSFPTTINPFSSNNFNPFANANNLFASSAINPFFQMPSLTPSKMLKIQSTSADINIPNNVTNISQPNTDISNNVEAKKSENPPTVRTNNTSTIAAIVTENTIANTATESKPKNKICKQNDDTCSVVSKASSATTSSKQEHLANHIENKKINHNNTSESKEKSHMHSRNVTATSSVKTMSKQINQPSMNAGLKCKKTCFPKPFSQIVAEREANVGGEHPATSMHLNCINVINSNNNVIQNDMMHASALNKSILKQQQAEDRRQQLREQQEMRLKTIADRNRKLQDKLKKDHKERIQKQKQKLSCKLQEAKSRYEQKLNEKTQKVKEQNDRIKIAAKAKQKEKAKQEQHKRELHQLKMAKACELHEKSLKMRTERAKSDIDKLKEITLTNSINTNLETRDKKNKMNKKMEQSEVRRKQILEDITQKQKNNHQLTKAVLERKRNIVLTQENLGKQLHYQPNEPSLDISDKQSNCMIKTRKRKKQSSKRKKHRKHEKSSDSKSSNSNSTNIESITSKKDQINLKINFCQINTIMQVMRQQSDEYHKCFQQNNKHLQKTGKQPQISKIINYITNIISRSKAEKSATYYQESNLKLCLHDVVTTINNTTIASSNDNSSEQLISLTKGLTQILAIKHSLNLSAVLENLIFEVMYSCCKTNIDCCIHIVQTNTVLVILDEASQKLFGQCISYINLFEKNDNNEATIVQDTKWCTLSHIISIHSQQSAIAEIMKVLTICFKNMGQSSSSNNLIQRWISMFRLLCVSKFFHRVDRLFHGIANENLVSISEYYFILNYILGFSHKISSFVELLDSNECNRICKEYEHITLTLKETGILGCLNLIACLILGSKPTVKHSKKEYWQQRKSVDAIRILLMCFQIANNVARLNLTYFQQIVKVTHMEFYHILTHLLSYLRYFFDSKENGINELSNKQSTILSETEHLLLDEIILFIGHCSINNKTFQECFHWGKEPNIIQKLCRLPFEYFSNSNKKAVLFSSLIALTFNNETALKIMNKEISSVHIARFIQTLSDKRQQNNSYNLTVLLTQELRQQVVNFFKFQNNVTKKINV